MKLDKEWYSLEEVIRILEFDFNDIQEILDELKLEED